MPRKRAGQLGFENGLVNGVMQRAKVGKPLSPEEVARNQALAPRRRRGSRRCSEP